MHVVVKLQGLFHATVRTVEVNFPHQTRNPEQQSAAVIAIRVWWSRAMFYWWRIPPQLQRCHQLPLGRKQCLTNPLCVKLPCCGLWPRENMNSSLANRRRLIFQWEASGPVFGILHYLVPYEHGMRSVAHVSCSIMMSREWFLLSRKLFQMFQKSMTCNVPNFGELRTTWRFVAYVIVLQF